MNVCVVVALFWGASLVHADMPPVFAHYSFDAATVSGSTVQDLSDNNRDATLFSGVTIASESPTQFGDYVRFPGARTGQQVDLGTGEREDAVCFADFTSATIFIDLRAWCRGTTICIALCSFVDDCMCWRCFHLLRIRSRALSRSLTLPHRR